MDNDVKQAHMVILASKNGRTDWFPVKNDDLPAWVKHPENMGRMVAGDICMKCDEGDKGSLWYMALSPEDVNRIAVSAAEHAARINMAQAKRARRRERNMASVH